MDADTARLMALTPADMPPESDDLGALLVLAQQRHGMETRSAVWRAIGIDPKRGRAFLTRNAQSVDWPLFKTLRLLAFTDDPEELRGTDDARPHPDV